MTTKTATVETLTAEVRVLMVGSRQVTLSVYSQLDYADFENIEPFGRVRPKDAQLDYIYLIGRHRETGTLTRSSIPGGYQSVRQESGWYAYQNAIRDVRTRAAVTTREMELHKTWEQNYHDQLGNSHQCYAEKIEAEQAEIEQAKADAARLEREYADIEAPFNEQAAEVSRLPLIVLAGLR
jgi:multidrug efflux pump subunit AcrA (membrane-fusion protein)